MILCFARNNVLRLLKGEGRLHRSLDGRCSFVQVVIICLLVLQPVFSHIFWVWQYMQPYENDLHRACQSKPYADSGDVQLGMTLESLLPFFEAAVLIFWKYSCLFPMFANCATAGCLGGLQNTASEKQLPNMCMILIYDLLGLWLCRAVLRLSLRTTACSSTYCAWNCMLVSLAAKFVVT